VKGIQVYSYKGPDPLQRGDNYRNVRKGWGHKIKSLILKNYEVRKAEFYMKAL
jgi:hypothetical protein